MTRSNRALCTRTGKKVANQNIFAGAETTTGANTEGVLASNHTLGNTGILPHHCFPVPVIKPSATNVANSRAIGTAISPSTGVMVPAHTAVPADLSIKVCMPHLLLHRSACKKNFQKDSKSFSGYIRR